jgi:DNA-binding transcriptional LysR family regulator
MGESTWRSFAEKTEAATWISGLWSKNRSRFSCRRIIGWPPGKQSVLRRLREKHLSAFPGLRSAFQTNSRRCAERSTGIMPSHEVDNLGGVMSLIASTGGVALLPVYAKTFLPDAVTTRPLEGVGPKIDLSVGYRKSNPSPTLKLFLSQVDELAAKLGG